MIWEDRQIGEESEYRHLVKKGEGTQDWEPAKKREGY
jgi:hypothetical protein